MIIYEEKNQCNVQPWTDKYFFEKDVFFFFYTLFIILNETHFVFQAIGTQQHHKSNPVLVVWIERLERNVSYIVYKNKK